MSSLLIRKKVYVKNFLSPVQQILNQITSIGLRIRTILKRLYVILRPATSQCFPGVHSKPFLKLSQCGSEAATGGFATGERLPMRPVRTISNEFKICSLYFNVPQAPVQYQIVIVIRNTQRNYKIQEDCCAALGFQSANWKIKLTHPLKPESKTLFF